MWFLGKYIFVTVNDKTSDRLSIKIITVNLSKKFGMGNPSQV